MPNMYEFGSFKDNWYGINVRTQAYIRHCMTWKSWEGYKVDFE